MAQTIADIMTPDPITLSLTSVVADAAREMRDNGVGDVLVHRNGQVCGIGTDRDLVVRVIADGMDPARTRLSEICTSEVVSVSPDTDLDDAVRVMREHAVRRLPVVANGQPVGIVSIGDMAIEMDPDSALAEVSAAAPSDLEGDTTIDGP